MHAAPFLVCKSQRSLEVDDTTRIKKWRCQRLVNMPKSHSSSEADWGN